MNKTSKNGAAVLNAALPWVAGAGLALGHIAVTSNCTVTTQGRCSTCGSCAVALISLVGWALLRNWRKDVMETKP